MRTRPILATLLVTLTACGATTSVDQRPIVVATTTQTADFARAVGGDELHVIDIMRSGIDPHHYEPTAADLHHITHAAVVVINGLGLEPWFDRARAATDPTGIVVVASRGVEVHNGDPHIWQSPTNAAVMVAHIGDALATAVPGQAAQIRARTKDYLASLEALDHEIATDMAGLTNRKIVTNHDAFGYFIERYGLTYVGSVIPSFDTSADLSTSEVRRLVARIQAEHVTAVFSEASLPPKAATALATEAHIRVIAGDDALYGDSLGPVGSDADTYLTMMRHNAKTIVAALQEG